MHFGLCNIKVYSKFLSSSVFNFFSFFLMPFKQRILIVLITELYCCYFYSVYSQSVSLTDYVTPENCSNSQFYNTHRLQCISCKNGTVASPDRLGCICPHGYLQTSAGCEQCLSGSVINVFYSFLPKKRNNNPPKKNNKKVCHKKAVWLHKVIC